MSCSKIMRRVQTLCTTPIFLLTLFFVFGLSSTSIHARSFHDSDEDFYFSPDEDDFFEVPFSSEPPRQKPTNESIAALRERTPECGHCASNSECESAFCYFGRCVTRSPGLRPHSVRRCFPFKPSGNALRAELCAQCRTDSDCFSKLCRFGQCLYPGVLTHISILVCFNDSYVESC